MIPLLAESEKGTGQAESFAVMQIEMWFESWSDLESQSVLEKTTLEGDSPVDKSRGLDS